MTTPAEARMADFKFEERIEHLISEEEDPKEKIRLLLMMRLNTTLVDNVVAVRKLTESFSEHRTEFEDHVRKDLKAMYFRRGAVWASIGLLGIIQSLCLYLVFQHIDFDRQVHKVVEEHSVFIAGHIQHHKTEEYYGKSSAVKN